MKRYLWMVLAGLLLCQPAWSAGGGGSGGGTSGSSGDLSRRDPEFAAGVRAVEEQNWSGALEHMRKVIQQDANNADAWNYMGYAYRHLGDMPNSFHHYERALQIYPNHRGAHEYVGEAYLQVNDLASAEVHLKALDKICWLPCEEYSELKEKIKAYKAEHSQQ